MANKRHKPSQPLYSRATLLLLLAPVLLTACTLGRPSSERDAEQGCWSTISAPEVGVGAVIMNGIAAISQNDIWAVGQQLSGASEESSTTLTMHWDGKEWNIIPSPNGSDAQAAKNHLYSVSTTPGGDVWAVGAYSADSVLFNTLAMRWDGTAWQLSPPPNPGQFGNILNDVAALSTDNVWAIGNYLTHEYQDGHMLILHWDGQQWTRVPTPPRATHNLLALKAFSKDDIWAAGTQVLHWNGSQWSISPVPEAYSGGYFDAIAAASPNDLWVLGNDGNDAVYLHWDGTAWSGGQTPKLADGPYPHDAEALSADSVWAAGEYTHNPSDRQMLLLHWNGQSWNTSPNPIPGEDTRLQALTSAGDTLWAVGSRGRDDASKPLFVRYAYGACLDDN
ncbi:MAG TPA: hypothetical protein VEX13_13070 [Chloroflexia bacterium]|nr:hypothetical protein [Chloroflexia bacterium]